jgi:hypothetical protein
MERDRERERGGGGGGGGTVANMCIIHIGNYVIKLQMTKKEKTQKKA